MKVHEFLIGLRPAIPMATNGTKPVPASNSQIRRWLVDKAVLINGATPGPDDQVDFPITQLVFFPKSDKKRTTLY